MHFTVGKFYLELKKSSWLLCGEWTVMGQGKWEKQLASSRRHPGEMMVTWADVAAVQIEMDLG